MTTTTGQCRTCQYFDRLQKNYKRGKCKRVAHLVEFGAERIYVFAEKRATETCEKYLRK